MVGGGPKISVNIPKLITCIRNSYDQHPQSSDQYPILPYSVIYFMGCHFMNHLPGMRPRTCTVPIAEEKTFVLENLLLFLGIRNQNN